MIYFRNGQPIDPDDAPAGPFGLAAYPPMQLYQHVCGQIVQAPGGDGPYYADWPPVAYQAALLVPPPVTTLTAWATCPQCARPFHAADLVLWIPDGPPRE